MVDVKLTVDAQQFWAVSYTGRLWLVDMATMEEVATYPTYLNLGIALTQMAIYQPFGVTGFPPPPGQSSSTDCPDTFLTDSPGKPVAKFLRTRGYLNQAAASSGVPVTLGQPPSSALKPRFRG
jgi:hypothetical protein